MKQLLPVFFAFATLPAFAVTPQVQHTCIGMGHFARQVYRARQSGLPAASVQRQADAAHGSRAEHRLWRDIIYSVYKLPPRTSTSQVEKGFYDNCMAQMRRMRR